MKVLIVDDDRVSCQCLQRLIDWETIGCTESLCAYNGMEALRLIEEEKPDIVVSDVKMPVMDGKELCRQIYEKYPDISMFFVSAYSDFDTAQMAIRYDVKGYVLKPLDMETLGALQNMIYETVVQKENTSFYWKICADEYRNVLKRAIKEKDDEMVGQLLDRVDRLQGKDGVKAANLWQHLITPIIDYKNTVLKMDYGVLFESERRMQKEILELPASERIPYLRRQYQDMMRKEPTNGNIVVWEVQKAIQERFSSPDLDINVLAEMFGMSPVYLGRLFIEQTGMKITDYIQEKRIRYACDELRNSVRSVKEIAQLAGYRDAGYFNKVFQAKMEMTPKKYREKYWHGK